MKVKQVTILKDALYNLNPNSGANVDYCKGLIVGTVSGLMAMGFDYQEAIKQVCASIPLCHWKFETILPESWVNDFRATWNGENN